MKHCGRCDKDRPETDFAKCRAKKDGLHNWCKECCANYSRDVARKKYKQQLDCGVCGGPLPKNKKKFCSPECFEKHRKVHKKEARREWYEKNRGAVIARQRKYYRENREEIALRERKRRRDNPDYFAEKKYKEKYGITLDEYGEILKEQGGSCAICGQDRGTRDRRMDVDHCHETGGVRGILCEPCNKGIGMFLDNPEWLESAAHYLRSYKRKAA